MNLQDQSTNVLARLYLYLSSVTDEHLSPLIESLKNELKSRGFDITDSVIYDLVIYEVTKVNGSVEWVDATIPKEIFFN